MYSSARILNPLRSGLRFGAQCLRSAAPLTAARPLSSSSFSTSRRATFGTSAGLKAGVFGAVSILGFSILYQNNRALVSDCDKTAAHPVAGTSAAPIEKGTPEYWRARWTNGQTGWHLNVPNPLMVAHEREFLYEADSCPTTTTVLVPLCGKTEDLYYLSKRSKTVIGCDVAALAFDQFRQEHNLTIDEEKKENQFTIQKSGNIHLYNGDVFHLECGPVDRILDRGALVALLPSQREQYVNQMLHLLKPNGRVLLVAFDYDQSKVDGPPFSVSLEEAKRLYKGCEVHRLSVQKSSTPPHFRSAGITECDEVVYLIVKKA